MAICSNIIATLWDAPAPTLRASVYAAESQRAKSRGRSELRDMVGGPLAKISAQLHKALDRDKVPLLLLGTGETEIVVAELKIRELEIPGAEHGWEACSCRRRIAEKRSRREYSRAFGIATRYLQTERLDGGLYSRLGWRPLQQVRYRGCGVLVMEKRLGVW